MPDKDKEFTVLFDYSNLSLRIFFKERTPFRINRSFIIAIPFQIPEMTAQIQYVEENETESKLAALVIQNVGLLTGFIIIMMLVMYGGNIEV